MLCCHHIVVVILGKPCAHPVARLARTSVAEVIRKDDEVSVGVEQLATPKQHIGKLRSKELLSGTSGAMEYQHRIRHTPASVICWLAECPVVRAELGQRIYAT